VTRVDTGLAAPAFSNPAPLVVPTLGPAAPYPATIAVSGLSGTVSDVRVRLTGLSHTFPSDLRAVLVGPDGTAVGLRPSGSSSSAVTGVTVTLRDDAATPLPVGDPLVSGSFRPVGGVATLATPAPAGPYATGLSSFDGTAPNGSWRLFLEDNGGGDAGLVAGGWGLDVDTTPLPPVTPVTPAPPTQPATPGTVTTASPATAPTLVLAGKRTQRLGRLAVRVTCSARCRLVGKATVYLSISRAETATLRLRTRPVTVRGSTVLRPVVPRARMPRPDDRFGNVTFRVTARTATGTVVATRTARIEP
jgi:hypothetical protein